MFVGVWFKNKEWVEKWFDDFLSKIDQNMIHGVRRSKTQPPIVIMKNGNYIRGISAKESSRGHKSDVAYLEPGIRDLDIFDYVIQPTVVTYDYFNFERDRYKKGEIYEGFYGGQVKLDQVP